MQYRIFGDMMPAVTIRLSRGESVYTQSGGMSWMTEGVQMESNLKGGFGKAFGRMFSGESLFMATFTATRDVDEVTFAAAMPGKILKFDIQPNYEIIAQKGAFLCAEHGVQLSTYFNRGVKGGLFGGEGFILQKYSGSGSVFCEIDGSVETIDLAPASCCAWIPATLPRLRRRCSIPPRWSRALRTYCSAERACSCPRCAAPAVSGSRP